MITRYVNTASSAGGDGTTNATTGANRAWATIQEAELALRGAGYSDDLTIWCCGSAANTGQLRMLSAYLAVGYTLYIRGNPNDPTGFHGGRLNTGTFRLENGGHVIYPSNTATVKVVFDGIQIRETSGSSNACFYCDSGMATGSAIRNCIIQSQTNSSHGIWAGVFTVDMVVENNVILGNGSGTYGLLAASTSTIKAYNNIISGFSQGATEIAGSSLTIKNCAVFGNGDDFVGSPTIDYCASDDGDGSNPISVSNWADQFFNENYDTEVDFRLATGSVLLDAGVGPSIDSDVPTADIVGDPRSGASASVGPFEEYTEYVPTRLDYRFIKWATDSGVEDDGEHGIQVKVASGGGISLGENGLSVDRAEIDEQFIYEYQITAADVTSKSVTLTTPMADTNQVAMVVFGSIPQSIGTDYTSTDSTTISWNGLGLDGVIVEGEEIQLQYPI